MRITGYVLFIIAFVIYATIWQAIWQLVRESRQVKPDTRFSRFWWLPAWRVHKKTYPSSNVRQQIVMRFILTFALRRWPGLHRLFDVSRHGLEAGFLRSLLTIERPTPDMGLSIAVNI